MTGSPRVVFGMAAYNRPDALARTLESLLGQTCREIAVVIADDQPSPEAMAIVERYSVRDARLAYRPNPRRLGMIGNWRRAFALARELHPDAEYFAWASDHDVWHPRWAEVLVRALDADPEAVMAYPQMMRLYRRGRRRMAGLSGTAGLTRARDRLRVATTGMTAGNGVYGLFRARVLERAGVFRDVLLPDRQLLEALSVYGVFHHVPEFLWYREVAGAFSYGRQRSMLFAGGVPLYGYLPPHVQHSAVLFWDLAVRGRGRPEHGRLAGLALAASQLWWATRRQALHGDAAWRRWWRIATGRFSKGERPVPDRAAAMTVEQ